MSVKFFAAIAWILGIMQIFLVLLSWLLSAAMPEMSVHSLLSSEGIRWFMSHFTEHIATPVLVWMLLLSIAYGAIRESGLLQTLASFLTTKSSQRPSINYRQKFALRLVLLELILFTILMILLTAVPHAVLLSLTGSLFPGSFSQSLVPVLAFLLTVMGISYGTMSGVQRSSAEVLASLSKGIAAAAPLYIIYILGAQLYYSILYVWIIH